MAWPASWTRVNDTKLSPRLAAPPPPPLSVFIPCSHTDGSVCLFMNTEVTCNQPERALAALRFRPVTTTSVDRACFGEQEEESDGYGRRQREWRGARYWKKKKNHLNCYMKDEKGKSLRTMAGEKNVKLLECEGFICISPWKDDELASNCWRIKTGMMEGLKCWRWDDGVKLAVNLRNAWLTPEDDARGDKREDRVAQEETQIHTHTDWTVEQRKNWRLALQLQHHRTRALGRISRCKIHLGAVTGANTFVSDWKLIS